MYWSMPIVLAALLLFTQQGLLSQARAPRTLAVVVAHADDEGPVAPILARYAREGVQVQLIIASDGVAGGGQQGNIPRPDTTVPGEELGRQRTEEARCATQPSASRRRSCLVSPTASWATTLAIVRSSTAWPSASPRNLRAFVRTQ